MPPETKTQQRARLHAVIEAARGIAKRQRGPARSQADDAAIDTEDRAIEERHEQFLMSIEPAEPIDARQVLARMRRVARKKLRH